MIMMNNPKCSTRVGCYNVNGLIRTAERDKSLIPEIKAMCHQHKINIMCITETHINNYEKQKKAYNFGNGHLFLNSLMNTRKGCKGTAVLHFINNRRKRHLTNENLIPGILQWTRFYTRKVPINIITIYASGRNNERDEEDDDNIYFTLIELLTRFNDENFVITGDMNINTNNPKSDRDKIWLELLETFQLKEHKSTKHTYIRREKGKIKKSHPDHIFVSKNITISNETILPSVTTNDHLILN